MSQAVEVSPRERAMSLLRAAVDALAGLDVAVMSDDELLDTLREVEVEKRRLAVPDHVLVAELDARGVGAARGCKNTTTLVMQLLRVDAREAQARLLAAQDLAPRRALSGEPLPPVFPLLAQASAEGAVSPAAAGLVARTIKQLPADVQDARGPEIEQTLVGYARSFGLAQLRVITRRLRDTYDQDGRLASDADRERQRHLDVRQHADGTVSGSRSCSTRSPGKRC